MANLVNVDWNEPYDDSYGWGHLYLFARDGAVEYIGRPNRQTPLAQAQPGDRILIGMAEAPKGGRLTNKLIHEVELHLIQQMRPVRNVEFCTRCKIRAGLEVLCTGESPFVTE